MLFIILGETKSVYGQSKTDVKRKLQEITYTNDSKVFKEIRGDIELDIWFEHYIGLKKRMIKARSLNQIKLAYNTHISPVLGNILICQISPNDFEEKQRSIGIIESKSKKIVDCNDNITINNLDEKALNKKWYNTKRYKNKNDYEETLLNRISS